MQEIAEAIQIGAKAYLNRQYKTIAVVGVIVLAIVTYFFNYLVGLGYFIGAFLSESLAMLVCLFLLKQMYEQLRLLEKIYNLV